MSKHAGAPLGAKHFLLTKMKQDRELLARAATLTAMPAPQSAPGLKGSASRVWSGLLNSGLLNRYGYLAGAGAGAAFFGPKIASFVLRRLFKAAIGVAITTLLTKRAKKNRLGLKFSMPKLLRRKSV